MSLRARARDPSPGGGTRGARPAERADDSIRSRPASPEQMRELDLWRAERVPVEDHAEPFEVAELPRRGARLDGGPLFTDFHEAIAAFNWHGEDRRVFFRLTPDRLSCGSSG